MYYLQSVVKQVNFERLNARLRRGTVRYSQEGYLKDLIQVVQDHICACRIPCSCLLCQMILVCFVNPFLSNSMCGCLL